MGLDMYLYRKSVDGKPVIKKWAGANEEELSFEVPGHEIAYWRKANQVHNWFVKNVQDGVDECQKSDVSYDQLMVLYKLAKQALVDRNPELLPPCEGFFFGPTEIDEWYWHNLVETCEMLSAALKGSREQEFIYESSW